jgi:hypothetical protein
MNRDEIIREVKRFFDVTELVCDHTYAKWGEKSWQFLDTDLLNCLLIIRRDIIKMPLYCNGKSAHQRGLRCNRCELVKGKNFVYLSSHVLGKALDLTCGVPSMTAEKMRQLIKQNAALLPCNIRIEGGVSWLHFDVLPQYGVNQKVYEFKA